jgi:hypothetical protein
MVAKKNTKQISSSQAIFIKTSRETDLVLFGHRLQKCCYFLLLPTVLRHF